MFCRVFSFLVLLFCGLLNTIEDAHADNVGWAGPASWPVSTQIIGRALPADESAVTSEISADALVIERARAQQDANGAGRLSHSHSLPPVNRRIVGLVIVYCVLIVTASVLGGMLPAWIDLTHTRMQTIISFVGGLMLGIGVFHLLPHATHSLPNFDAVVSWMMGGMLAMFLLIRTFHFHHHGPLEVSVSHDKDVVVEVATSKLACGHEHEDGHGHEHRSEHEHGNGKLAGGRGEKGFVLERLRQQGPPCQHAHQLSWLGIALGLSIHTLIDGIALAASVQAESAHPAFLSLFGLGTFLAVMLHKPLDAVSITSLMIVSGWTQRSRNLVNAGFATMCPAGAMIFLMGATQLGSLQAYAVGAALAFSAGVFICISLSDLLPEMEFHAHNRARLTVALLGGIFLAWSITFLEPGHLH